MKMQIFLRLLFCALIALPFFGSRQPAAQAQTEEFRAIWVDAWGTGFLTSSQVTDLVNRCNTYNFNAVVVQMRRRGDAFYMPQAPNGDPRTTALSSGYDALQELITQCHAANPPIEVHCWVTTQLVWSGTSAPSQPGHVYNLHPEYFMKSSTGATHIGEGYYLDPGHPDATQWNYNMAMDIVSRYDIDGFHWDYIRYPQQDSGYNEVAVARYNEEFGLTGTPSPGDAQWSEWRRRQVTDFLRWANSDLLEVKPDLTISAAVFASRSDAFGYRFQDWAAWNNEGIIDLCMPMNYTSTNSTFNSRTTDAYNNQGIRWVIMGQGAYLNSKENTVTQLSYARSKPLNGTVFYSYRTPNSGTVDQNGTFAYVRDNYQSSYVGVPDLPWKINPVNGILKGTITRQDTGEAVYNATVTLQTPSTKNQLTEPHGKYAFFEADAGTYNITATAPGLGVASGTAVIVAGQVTNVNLVLPATDTTPPVLSNVQANDITDTAATINWTTDEASDSLVEYGPTTSYGSSESATGMVISHSVNLTGLSPDTVYHFRVQSTDSNSNTATSADFTFTTLASGQVPDIIIDNAAATVVGTWSTGSSATDKYGSDYRFNGQGTGARYLEYRPSISTAGNYEIYEWHPQGTNRTLAAPHEITHSGGTSIVDVNQQTGGGAWNLLGTYYLTAGTSNHVIISDAIPDAGQVVMADAIKFVHAGDATPPTTPAAPSDLTVTGSRGGNVDLQWTDNADNEDSFIVEYKLSSASTWTIAGSATANTTNFTVSGLNKKSSYDFRVKATNSAGDSAYSNVATRP